MLTLADKLRQIADMLDNNNLHCNNLKRIINNHYRSCDIKPHKQTNDRMEFEVKVEIGGGIGTGITDDLWKEGYIISGIYTRNVLPYQLLIRRI